MTDTYRRTGPEAKCPACGWRIDNDAYRCPKCLIYFCYKCRKRVQKGDLQFQCVNQTCTCHGKLICLACTVTVPEFGDVTRQVFHYGKSGSRHVVVWTAAILGGITLIVAGIWHAVAVAAVVIILGALILSMLGKPFCDQPTTYTNVTTNEKIGEHRCCIQCRKPAEILR